jgi:predicted phage gp36 major capsid-like protein
MAKLKDHIIKQEEHSRLIFDNLRDALAKAKETNHKYNSDVHKDQPSFDSMPKFIPKSEDFLYKHNGTMRGWKSPISEVRATQAVHKVNTMKHQWAEDMPDLEGKALADAEKQFDYDSWLGEHGIGE